MRCGGGREPRDAAHEARRCSPTPASEAQRCRARASCGFERHPQSWCARRARGDRRRLDPRQETLERVTADSIELAAMGRDSRTNSGAERPRGALWRTDSDRRRGLVHIAVAPRRDAIRSARVGLLSSINVASKAGASGAASRSVAACTCSSSFGWSARCSCCDRSRRSGAALVDLGDAPPRPSSRRGNARLERALGRERRVERPLCTSSLDSGEHALHPELVLDELERGSSGGSPRRPAERAAAFSPLSRVRY
jgi:hypothetical protein